MIGMHRHEFMPDALRRAVCGGFAATRVRTALVYSLLTGVEAVPAGELNRRWNWHSQDMRAYKLEREKLAVRTVPRAPF